ncbi:hypothetical protein [Rhabdothermincola salaria]|uniref:hypothetical protein n=1 Tax=Rhabdothermincola salaria TaxID=2903142 RepID=UPI001E28B13B|nr:hypothetical protein [Rhabdothermincola salaria]MCD9624601.1 hypothetical protein [Rhabdothermincola salaria]
MRPDSSPSRPARPSAIPALDRRGFLRRAGLVGGAGLVALGAPTLLAACGGSSDDQDATGRMDLAPVGTTLVGLFNYQGGYLAAGIPQRAAFAISSAAGAPTSDGPDTISARLSREGVDKGEVELRKHADGTPIAYYPLLTTFDEPGIWGLTTTFDDTESTQNFQVDRPEQVELVQPGQAMIPVATPTVADARGVTPICTAEPQCPLHERSLAEVLAAGGPVALLISTPRYCSTTVCGPVLDLVIEESAAVSGLTVVHAEVYVDPAAGPDPASAGTTDAVDAYGLSFEPSLFVARGDGMVTARLDNVMDRGELAEALASSTS